MANARPSRRESLRVPSCHHKPTGYVEAGRADTGGAHASTVVCSREHCVQDARDWAEVTTSLPSHHTVWHTE